MKCKHCGLSIEKQVPAVNTVYNWTHSKGGSVYCNLIATPLKEWPSKKGRKKK